MVHIGSCSGEAVMRDSEENEWLDLKQGDVQIMTPHDHSREGLSYIMRLHVVVHLSCVFQVRNSSDIVSNISALYLTFFWRIIATGDDQYSDMTIGSAQAIRTVRISHHHVRNMKPRTGSWGLTLGSRALMKIAGLSQAMLMSRSSL